MLQTTGRVFELEMSDSDESNKELTASALKTKTENDVKRTRPYSFESLPVTTTTEDALEAADLMVNFTL